MPRMNISLDEDVMKALRELSDKEDRPISRQIKHMMDFYLSHKKGD